MAITSPDNLPSPDASGAVKPITNFKALADATQAALVKRANLYTGTSAARAAFLSTAPEGTHWQDTNGTKFLYVKKDSVWMLVSGQVLWSSTTAGTGSAAGPAFINQFALTGLPVGQTIIVSFSGAGISGAAASMASASAHYTIDGSSLTNAKPLLGIGRVYLSGSGFVNTVPAISGTATIGAGGTLNAGLYSGATWYKVDPITATATVA